MLLGAFSKIMGQLPKASQKKMGEGGGKDIKGVMVLHNLVRPRPLTAPEKTQDGAKMFPFTRRRPANGQVGTTNGPDSSPPADCDLGHFSSCPRRPSTLSRWPDTNRKQLTDTQRKKNKEFKLDLLPFERIRIWV